MTGQIAWVVGGAGVAGRALCLACLKAGATVIMNSGTSRHLSKLRADFNNPDNLICITGTLLPDRAEAVVQQAMEMTGGRLDHVFAHNGLRWWPSETPGLGSGSLDPTSPLVDDDDAQLDGDPNSFVLKSSAATLTHYSAAQQLLPHLTKQTSPSYTFLTGKARRKNLVSQVNTHSVRGLASGLVELYEGSHVRVSALHVEGFDDEHDILSILARLAGIGEVCAGMAASAESFNGVRTLRSGEDMNRLRQQFPYGEFVEGLPTLFIR
jgi:NAD(P)-dependent dehydrogenase (short-subunit alcohol dehydrogenase family)